MGIGDRLCLRLRSRFPVFFKTPGSPRWTKAFSVDLSTSGLGLLTRQPVEKDSVIELRLGLRGSIGKVVFRGRVVHQMPAKGKGRGMLSTGIRFEEVPAHVLDSITRFISKQLNMTGPRIGALLNGGAVFTLLIFRFLYYSALGIFQGTAFGREWITGSWASCSSEKLAFFYFMLAVLVLTACFCFFCKQRGASRAVFMVACVGFLDQGIRWALKVPYLFQGAPDVWIFLFETVALSLWGMLVWNMLRYGGNYEQALQSMREDTGYKPASPEPPPPPEKKPPVNHVFLP